VSAAYLVFVKKRYTMAGSSSVKEQLKREMDFLENEYIRAQMYVMEYQACHTQARQTLRNNKGDNEFSNPVAEEQEARKRLEEVTRAKDAAKAKFERKKAQYQSFQ
jgi:hypothetical protein